MSEEGSIVPVPVAPLVTPEEAAKKWQLFEALKAKLLSNDDYQTIASKRFITRSGFRKLGVFFGISDRIIKEERSDREDGSFSWRITVEAVAPNGRSSVGVGACDSRERKFAHTEHDVYATAHTRAKSRAISDLVAGGVVSAEEISPGDVEETVEPAASEPLIKVPITKENMQQEGLRQFPLTDGLKAVGMLNVLEDQVSIVPETALKAESAPINSFLVPKVLDPLCSKNGFSYKLNKDSDGNLTYIFVIGRLTDTQIKELQSAARWAFIKAAATVSTDPKLPSENNVKEKETPSQS